MDAQYALDVKSITVYGLADGNFFSSDFKYNGKYGEIDFANHTDKEGNYDIRKSTPSKYKGIQLSNRVLALVRAKFVQHYFDLCFFNDSYQKFRPKDSDLFQMASPEKGSLLRGIRIEAVFIITKEEAPA